MSNSKKILIAVAVVVVLVVLYILGTYNGLISASEGIDNQWAQVETQYQRRFDLIPNLVDSVKIAMSQEQKIFGEIANARANYAGAKTVNDKAKAASEVEGSFSRLLAIMENYPQVKSTENVQILMAQLEGTENRISVERKRFNDMTQSYNLKVKRFPGNVVASLFGFGEKDYFEAASGAENAPKVEL